MNFAALQERVASLPQELQDKILLQLIQLCLIQRPIPRSLLLESSNSLLEMGVTRCTLVGRTCSRR